MAYFHTFIGACVHAVTGPSTNEGYCAGISLTGMTHYLHDDAPTYRKFIKIITRLYRQAVREKRFANDDELFHLTWSKTLRPHDVEKLDQLHQFILKKIQALSNDNQKKFHAICKDIRSHQNRQDNHLPDEKEIHCESKAIPDFMNDKSFAMTYFSGLRQSAEQYEFSFGVFFTGNIIYNEPSAYTQKSRYGNHTIQIIEFDNFISSDHVAFIGYSPREHRWTYIEANNLPITYPTDNTVLVEQVWRSFKINEHASTLRVASIAVSVSHQSAFTTAFSAWSNQQQINAIYHQLGLCLFEVAHSEDTEKNLAVAEWLKKRSDDRSVEYRNLQSNAGFFKLLKRVGRDVIGAVSSACCKRELK